MLPCILLQYNKLHSFNDYWYNNSLHITIFCDIFTMTQPGCWYRFRSAGHLFHKILLHGKSFPWHPLARGCYGKDFNLKEDAIGKTSICKRAHGKIFNLKKEDMERHHLEESVSVLGRCQNSPSADLIELKSPKTSRKW